MSVSGGEPNPLAALQPEQFEGCGVCTPELLIRAQQ